ncbi:MAG: glucose-6-phosphate isomerase [Gammaproteobacteria bacterium]
MTKLTELPGYKELQTHQQEIAHERMRDWFAADNTRAKQLSFEWQDFLFDYSRHRISSKTLDLLFNLAKNANLSQKINDLFSGASVNNTEKRPALHTALRDQLKRPVNVKGKNIADEIEATQQKMRDIVDQVHKQTWLGVTGKPIKHIVNIGIGGSYLGPKMAVEALHHYSHPDLTCYFISSVDREHLERTWQKIDPETTLFIISSKSFTTIETMTNANTIVAWMKEKLGPDVLSKQFIAITSAPKKAEQFGIVAAHILPMWDWVGGRYSVWSAIGLPLALMIGNQHFADFLAGGFEMDEHFKQTDLTHNIPVIMALLGIWYTNFFDARTQAIIPYSNCLRYLVPYLQQAEMESNGKSVALNGDSLDYITTPILFGEEGVNGQHAYHQLLHQGTHLVPMDFILTGQNADGTTDIHHQILMASALSQATAFMQGKTYEEAKQELLAANYDPAEAEFLAHHRIITGNKPSTVIFMKRLTPKNLGSLIAMYEHKIFVQSVIWGINPFDQWGVELGKELLPDILLKLQGQENVDNKTSANHLIAHVRKTQG